MTRRNLARKLGLTAGTELLASTRALAATPEPVAPLAFAAAPVLFNPAPDGVSILCVFKGLATGWVEYGETEVLGKRCDGDAGGLRPYNDHLTFRLDGLKPGQRCFYRAHAVKMRFNGAYDIRRGEEIVSELRSFRTLDPGAGEASFTVWNDTHETTPTIERLAAMHREQPTDFLVWNGDVVNDLPDRQKLFDEYLNPGGQAFADSVPYFLNRGNHDVRGAGARLLPQFITGPEGRYYHAFRHGPLGCLVLDTGEDKPDGVPDYAGLATFDDYRTAQQHWLARAIKEPMFASAPIKVAFLHIPLFWEAALPDGWLETWGGFNGWVTEDGRRKWHDLLLQAGVKLVISGHTHHRAWFPANTDRPYGQLIGGGPTEGSATSIIVRANSRELRFEMKDLAGRNVLGDTVPT